MMYYLTSDHAGNRHSHNAKRNFVSLNSAIDLLSDLNGVWKTLEFSPTG